MSTYPNARTSSQTIGEDPNMFALALSDIHGGALFFFPGRSTPEPGLPPPSPPPSQRAPLAPLAQSPARPRPGSGLAAECPRRARILGQRPSRQRQQQQQQQRPQSVQRCRRPPDEWPRRSGRPRDTPSQTRGTGLRSALNISKDNIQIENHPKTVSTSSKTVDRKKSYRDIDLSA